MAEVTLLKPPFRLRIGQGQLEALRRHLFPGDGEEHGAVLLCGAATASTGTRLLVRHVVLAEDGTDYVPGRRGYRMLTERFVRHQIRRARDEGLSYLAVHNHGGGGAVSFSGPDLASHERGYPALLDIVSGPAVGALVLNSDCLAGDIWLPGRDRHPLDSTVVVGRPLERLYPAPPSSPTQSADVGVSRQTALYGVAGHAIMRASKVAIVGLGGIGMIVTHLLAGLRVGAVVLIDNDTVEPSNLPRLPGARRRDAMPWLWRENGGIVHVIGRRLARHKVQVARRILKTADPGIEVTALAGDIADADVAARISDCDFIFLAADSFRARNTVNALAHAYLIPTVQLGSKVEAAPDGTISGIYSYVRPVFPEAGCLMCAGLVPPGRLQAETITAEHARRQRYVDDPDVIAPSVITLNARSAAVAADEFMMTTTGLWDPSAHFAYLRLETRSRRYVHQEPRRDPRCRHCGDEGYRALGDAACLPLRQASDIPKTRCHVLMRQLRGLLGE